MRILEYAIDRNINDKTNRVHYSDANYSRKEYLCPDCLERVFLKKNCFSHEPIHNRTPIQRACPEYHPGADVHDLISNPVDRLYIYNVGIPLYLCGEGTFELRAIIPMISDKTLDKLKKEDAKLHFNTNAPLESEKKVYRLDNLSFYKVDSLQEWIEVKCVPDLFVDEEIRKKWLWGIRGIDIENDIFHSNISGGYRVALKGHIIIGSHYRILHHSKTMPCIDGITFEKIGTINLKKFNGFTYSKIVCDVYEMQILSVTNESTLFIENKGYKLSRQKDDLIPLWPPAVFIGNQLNYNKSKALFLHIKSNSKESVHMTQGSQIIKVKDESFTNKSVISILVNEYKAIWFSQTSNPASEIRYHIQHSEFQMKHQKAIKKFVFTDINGNQIQLNQADQLAPIEGKLYITSNLPFCATVRKGNYVMSSSSICFEKVDYFWNLIIDSKAFGRTIYQYRREELPQVELGNIDWQKEYKKLSSHRSPVIKSNHRHIELLNILKTVFDEQSYSAYRLLEIWIKTNCIPISAMNDLDNLARRLRG